MKSSYGPLETLSDNFKVLAQEVGKLTSKIIDLRFDLAEATKRLKELERVYEKR